MAIFHFDAKVIGRSTGRTSTGAAAYRAGERIEDERTGLVHDYSRKRGISYCEVILPAHAPAWMSDRSKLWNAVEMVEKRHDAQVAREVMVALPQELNHDQRRQLIRDFVRKTFVSHGMIADVAFHDMKGKNPHAHILLTMRPVEGEQFGKKERAWNNQALVGMWREQWEIHANKALEQHHHEARIDRRSHKDKEDGLLPQTHLGHVAHGLEQRGIPSELGDHNRAVAVANKEIQQLRAEEERLKKQMIELQTQLCMQAQFPDMNVPVPSTSFMAYEEAPSETQNDSVMPLTSTSSSDRTRLAVQRQLQAMGAERYEIGLRDLKTGKMILRHWTGEEILDDKKLQWLKRMNSQGHDIYVRPEGSQGLVLVDDVGLGTIQRMTRQGHHPAVVVETSPMNYQVWIRLSKDPIPNALATQSAKVLAEQYDGDPNSADWRHFGRLAGFTNRKPVHMRSSGSPYVLAHDCDGLIAPNAQEILHQAQARLQAKDVTKIREFSSEEDRARLSRSTVALEEGYSSEKEQAYVTFQKIYQRFHERFGKPKDFSRTDWSICRALALSGYSTESIKYALSEGSPDLERRKLGHFEDYVNRTVNKIMRRPEVEETRKQRLIEQDKGLAQHEGTVHHEREFTL